MEGKGIGDAVYRKSRYLAPVGSGTGAVGRRVPPSPVSSSRRITLSVRISRTTRSCTLHDKGYGADRAGAAAQERG